MLNEYKAPKSKKCLNCYWYEYLNVYGDNGGKCTKNDKCTRIKDKYDKD